MTSGTTTTACANGCAGTWRAAWPSKTTFSATAGHYYNRLTELFRRIHQGDMSIGLPLYNGGLFAPDAAPILERIRLPDTVVASIIYDLSHTAAGAPENGFRRFVN